MTEYMAGIGRFGDCLSEAIAAVYLYAHGAFVPGMRVKRNIYAL